VLETAPETVPRTDPDIRLVAVDLDGTLLDAHGRVPDALWPLLEVMRERGIAFVPASGRQYATLRQIFDREANGMPFIAENGTVVVRDGVELSVVTLAASFVSRVLADLRTLAATGVDLGVVVCGMRCAYVERADEAFLAEVRKYYVAHEVVPDLSALAVDAVKLAVFDFGDAEREVAPALAHVRVTHQVVVSGAHWVDIMPPDVNKGVALRVLQKALGVTPEQTVAFGDYLNDVEMLQAAGHSYAMANAHPDVQRVARRQAPSHADEGVITVLRELLGRDSPTSA
jgi:Cof subfamily protein (haloacid dehalogenase superfamily)